MARANDRALLAELIENLAARFASLGGVVIGEHTELGIPALDWRMDHVAGNEGISPRLPNHHREMIDGMAWRWDQPHLLAKREIAFDNLLALGGNDRQYRIGDPRKAGRVFLFACGPVLELAVSHDVFGLGKSGDPAAIFEASVPADVIAVQMGAHHVVDVVHRETGGSKTFLEAVAVHQVPDRTHRPVFVITDAGIDQDVVARCLDHKALDAKQDAARSVDEFRY